MNLFIEVLYFLFKIIFRKTYLRFLMEIEEVIAESELDQKG